MKQIVLPNVRKLFIPDPGYVMFEADLKGADAQVVAWEAEDDDLKRAFRAGDDVHIKNAEDMWGSEFTRLPLGSHARDAKRQQNKVAVHLTNYGGTSRTLAITQGWTVHEADRFQRRWFSLHPGIRDIFQGRVRADLERSRTITNAFGFRRVYFDRIDACFGEALAWKPQSVVAINANRGLLQLEERYFPDALSREGILLQNHDAGTFQFAPGRVPPVEEIQATLRVVTPYPDPLVIPWDLKRSTKSWGELEKC